MKDYATETDVITTADPLFYPGDHVQWMNRQGYVRDFAWDTLNKTWTYCVLCEKPFDGLIASSEVAEKDLSLFTSLKKTLSV